MRISSIRIENFRTLRKVDIDLRPLSVVVGPNGAGKSSLLEFINAVCSIGKQPFQNAISKWGGFNQALSYGALETDPLMGFEIGVSGSDDSKTLEYDLKLRAESGSYFVTREKLVEKPADTQEKALFDRHELAGTYWSVGGQSDQRFRSHHGQNWSLPAMSHEVLRGSEFLSILRKTSLWPIHSFLLNDRTKGPQQLLPTTVPTADGSDYLSALYSLRAGQRRRYLELVEALKSAIPELEEIEFPLAGAGHVSLAWRQSNLPRELYPNQLSDGTLRFLWLMTILHTVPDDGLVLLDEPEISLHPQWLMLLVSILRKVSARTNIIVATQSAEFLRWIEPTELLIADSSESGTTFKWANEREDLATWLKEFTLSDLWTMGELGGRR